MTEGTGMGDSPLAGEDEPQWDEMSTEELAELALGSDLWLNAPALSHLGERSPEAARPVAIQALRGSDTLLAATAVRVLAMSDMDAALDYMNRAAPTWPLWILDSMVEVLAVDHPIHGDRAPELLNQIARRLSQPANSKEYNLAELFFRQYPQLRVGGC